MRVARPTDVAQLHALETASFPSDRLSLRQLRQHAAGRSHAVFVVAEQQGDIVGNGLVFFRAGSRSARLYSLVVSERARGLGLGRRLLERLEREARARGAAEMRLEVRTRGKAAVALYESAGYRRDAHLEGFYEDGTDAWRYRKPLGPPPRRSLPTP